MLNEELADQGVHVGHTAIAGRIAQLFLMPEYWT
jgi:hypothetical protein